MSLVRCYTFYLVSSKLVMQLLHVGNWQHSLEQHPWAELPHLSDLPVRHSERSQLAVQHIQQAHLGDGNS